MQTPFVNDVFQASADHAEAETRQRLARGLPINALPAGLAVGAMGEDSDEFHLSRRRISHFWLTHEHVPPNWEFSIHGSQERAMREYKPFLATPFARTFYRYVSPEARSFYLDCAFADRGHFLLKKTTFFQDAGEEASMVSVLSFTRMANSVHMYSVVAMRYNPDQAGSIVSEPTPMSVVFVHHRLRPTSFKFTGEDMIVDVSNMFCKST